MQPNPSWTWDDERSDWGVTIDLAARELQWWGSDKPIGNVPAFALGGGGQTQRFEEFLAHGPPYPCPPGVLAEVRRAVDLAMGRGGGEAPPG